MTSGAGPALLSVQVPASVAVGQSLTVTWRLVDAAEVVSTQAQVVDPFGEAINGCGPAQLVSGTASDGTYEQDCELSLDSTTGLYSVHIAATNGAGEPRIVPSAGDASFMVTGGGGDAVPPVVSDVTVPTSVMAGEAFLITWRLTDASGVSSTSGSVLSPTRQSVPGCWGGQRISGTATDGTYRTSCTIPGEASNGTYRVGIQAQDTVGNSRMAPYPPADPDATFMVTGGGGDAVPPVVSDVTVPTSVTAGEAFLITWRLTDASGVSSTSGSVLSPTRQSVPGCWGGQRISGTATDGTYRTSCTIPGEASNGTYRVGIQAQDTVGNSRMAPYPPADPDATFMVTGGGGDAAPPVVSDVTVPTSVTAGEAFLITWRLTDASGVSSTSGSVLSPTRQSVPGCWGGQRISGTATDGTYRTSCTIPGEASNGTYRVGIQAQDTVGNSRVAPYPPADPDATFTVTGGGENATVPAAPVSVSAVPGDASATVSWSAAGDGGSPITSYLVTSSPEGKTCPTTEATTCTVTGLTNGTAVHVHGHRHQHHRDLGPLHPISRSHPRSRGATSNGAGRAGVGVGSPRGCLGDGVLVGCR